MIRITCTKCNESFRVADQYLQDKTEMSCPNCDKPLSQDLVDSLVEYAKSKINTWSCFNKVRELALDNLSDSVMPDTIWHISEED